jgi:hypothetical protein
LVNFAWQASQWYTGLVAEITQVITVLHGSISVVVPEWLSGMTRNHVGFARAGSNPADHAFFL